MPVFFPTVQWYLVVVNASWTNRRNNPIKKIIVKVENGVTSVTKEVIIPSLLAISETDYLAKPEQWIKELRFMVPVLKIDLGVAPTQIKVSLVDYNNMQSAETTQALAAAAVTEETLAWDDIHWDRLSVQALVGASQIQVYNPVSPTGREATAPGDPDWAYPAWTPGDVVYVGTEQVTIDVSPSAATGLYNLTAPLAQTWPVNTQCYRV